MRRLAVLIVALAGLLASGVAHARPAYHLAHRMASDKAWQNCFAWYPLDPYSQRCANIAIIAGYTHYTAACRYFTFVTERNRAGRVLRTRIKSCDNRFGGYTTVVYRIDGYLSGAARVVPHSGNVAVDAFRWLGF